MAEMRATAKLGMRIPIGVRAYATSPIPVSHRTPGISSVECAMPDEGGNHESIKRASAASSARCLMRHSEALRSIPRHSEAFRGHQRQSEALRGTQRHSEAIVRLRVAIRGTQSTPPAELSASVQFATR
jgi:hypothetical protein